MKNHKQMHIPLPLMLQRTRQESHGGSGKKGFIRESTSLETGKPTEPRELSAVHEILKVQENYILDDDDRPDSLARLRMKRRNLANNQSDGHLHHSNDALRKSQRQLQFAAGMM